MYPSIWLLKKIEKPFFMIGIDVKKLDPNLPVCNIMFYTESLKSKIDLRYYQLFSSEFKYRK